MVETILPNLHRIEIPLPENPLKYLNSYVITSPDRNLLIDTGFNRSECFEAMQAGLNELNVNLARTDFFITHLHADHFGQVSTLVTDTSKVYFNQPDADSMRAFDGFEYLIPYAVLNGFPEEEVRAAVSEHPGVKYESGFIPDLIILGDGDRIDVGDFRFRCVATPGHTRGHLCLYEPQKRILLSGDHILLDITPNIQSWEDDLNPLKNYLASLRKVHPLDVDLVLPGHRRLFRNFKERVDGLLLHHRTRLDEVLEILNESPRSAYQTASRMTWDIRFDYWEEFPVMQKWFATGEAIAHLLFLKEEGKIHRSETNGTFVYALK